MHIQFIVHCHNMGLRKNLSLFFYQYAFTCTCTLYIFHKEWFITFLFEVYHFVCAKAFLFVLFFFK